MSLIIFARNLLAKLSLGQFRLAVAKTVLFVEDNASLEGQHTFAGITTNGLSLVEPFHAVLYAPYGVTPFFFVA